MTIAAPGRPSGEPLANGTRTWRDIPLWRDVPEEKWNDWRWQAGHAVKSLEELREVIPPTEDEERGVIDCAKYFKFAIPPYYASLMDPNDPNCPVRLQAVPKVSETYFSPADIHDPLGEDTDSPAPGITHRYPDRVLFLITDYCGMYCRFCTRRRFVAHDHGIQSLRALEPAFQYLEGAKEIRDVLISGGDPLMVKDEYIGGVLKRLREIDHIEIVRIGSKVPCTTPMRITPSLVSILKAYHPLWVNTHFNHPKELTPEAAKACAMLADAGIPLGCQTVLLRGVNDCPTIMKRLMHKLVQNRVRPYYIYQCDLSEGIEHFRTKVAKGIEIIEHLRQHTSGYAVPTFVVDAPGGGGKIPVMPNYLISMSDKKIVLRNFEGGMFSYPEPDVPPSPCPDRCPHCQGDARASTEGVAGILANKRDRIVPTDTMRERRRRENRSRPPVPIPIEIPPPN